MSVTHESTSTCVIYYYLCFYLLFVFIRVRTTLPLLLYPEAPFVVHGAQYLWPPLTRSTILVCIGLPTLSQNNLFQSLFWECPSRDVVQIQTLVSVSSSDSGAA